jgi:hypothetical protein
MIKRGHLDRHSPCSRLRLPPERQSKTILRSRHSEVHSAAKTEAPLPAGLVVCDAQHRAGATIRSASHVGMSATVITPRSAFCAVGFWRQKRKPPRRAAVVLLLSAGSTPQGRLPRVGVLRFQQEQSRNQSTVVLNREDGRVRLGPPFVRQGWQRWCCWRNDGAAMLSSSHDVKLLFTLWLGRRRR